MSCLFALSIDITIDKGNTNTSCRHIQLVVVDFALNVVYYDRSMKKLAPIDFFLAEEKCVRSDIRNESLSSSR
jgi:hypothetical protein